jgi:hypothetical protein
LRAAGDLGQEVQKVEALSVGAFEVAASVANDGELALVVTMRDRGARYPIGRYPEIREFEAILAGLQPGPVWNGAHFCASVEAAAREGEPLFHFCRRTDGVLLTFSPAEWRCLDDLFRQFLAKPGLRAALDRLSLEHGEL